MTAKNKIDVLVMAGFDPTGNAGLLRDAEALKSIDKTVFTLPTALAWQTDHTWIGTTSFSPKQNDQHIEVLKKLHFKALKIGMIGPIQQTKKLLSSLPLTQLKQKIVFDPVFKTTSGGTLTSLKNIKEVIQILKPFSPLITPNGPEAALLLDQTFHPKNDVLILAQNFFETFEVPVLLKGGHFNSKTKDIYIDHKQTVVLESKKSTTTKNVRGTGCYLSSLIAGFVSEQMSFKEACLKAKRILTKDLF